MFCFQKISVRREGLSHVEWPETEKDKMAQVLTPDYTSEDEAAEREKNVRISLRIIWELEELRAKKRQLDQVAVEQFSDRQAIISASVRGWTQPSQCPVPEEPEEWAVDARYLLC